MPWLKLWYNYSSEALGGGAGPAWRCTERGAWAQRRWGGRRGPCFLEGVCISLSGWCFRCGKHIPFMESPGEETWHFLFLPMLLQKANTKPRKKGGKGGSGTLWLGQDARLQKTTSGFLPRDGEEKAPFLCHILRSIRNQKRISPP